MTARIETTVLGRAGTTVGDGPVEEAIARVRDHGPVAELPELLDRLGR